MEMTRDALLARCRATCKWPACTGRGDLDTYAHECGVAGIPAATPPCGFPVITGSGQVIACGQPSVTLLPSGRRCPDHRPPAPPRGYCAPARCYCGPGPCQRPFADRTPAGRISDGAA